jgi:hypothetical protein
MFTMGCSVVPRPYPWNFPPAHEWNAPMETSWINLVDHWRKATTPQNKIYCELTKSEQPDFGYEIEKLKALERDLEEHELYQ